MNVLFDGFLIVVGIAALTWSGDKLVAFAGGLGEKARLSPAVIGLTIVAAGTSMPEMLVSVTAGIIGKTDIAVGNVVGSNIFNIAFILGVCALVAPIPISRNLFRLDYPFLIVVTWTMLLLARDGVIDRLEAGYFIVAMGLFWAYSVWLARRAVSVAEEKELAELVPAESEGLSERSMWFLLGGTLLSFAGLGVAARILVAGAADLALLAGLSERVVGLTIVAAGTSTPELVASLMAARRNQHEMAVTNIVGSNIFNILGILGVSGLISPLAVSGRVVGVDNWVMLVTAVALFPLMFTGSRINRAEGAVLLAGYLIFLGYLILGI